MAASNRDLESAIQQGVFRKDLYFRLNVVTLRLPPLRERKSDIPLLAHQFLDRFSGSQRRRPALSEEALNCLLAYDWPGNVRELENCMERAVALGSGPVLHVADLPTNLQNSAAGRAGGARGRRAGAPVERIGTAGHPAGRYRGKGGQAVGRTDARHRQNHLVPEAKGVRGALIPKRNSVSGLGVTGLLTPSAPNT